MKTANNEISEILNPAEFDFIEDVESLVFTANVGIFDAIIHLCDKKQLEFEQVIPLIKANPILKNKLTLEAERLHFIKPKKARLPRRSK